MYPPFNAGTIASHVDYFSTQDLEELDQRLRKFYKDILSAEYSHFCWDKVFGQDQGRLNYLVAMKGGPTVVTGNVAWGARPFPDKVEDILNGRSKNLLVHWAGCPKPTPISPSSLPGSDIWKFFYYRALDNCNSSRIMAKLPFYVGNLRQLPMTLARRIKRGLQAWLSQ